MYVPNTTAEQQQMLEAIGVTSLEDLFSVIPENLRLQKPLPLPPALTELELTRHLTTLAAENRVGEEAICFLGGGCYDHFVPAAVDAIAGRSEYYTAYTPYQAEASQGTLQVGFEFQTLVCQLTGLEVANASLYEAATAVVEAATLALSSPDRAGKIVISATVHPEYRRTLATYLANLPTQLVTIPAKNGVTDEDALAAALDPDTAGVIVQSPNFFGLIEGVERAAGLAKKAGAVAIQAFDPVSLGWLRRPGELGMDVAVAEGQGLGTPPSFGGPFLGLFACREAFVRRIPGRVVGQTLDRQGKRAFVLTLQTREQHIRREKATSNICTNQGLLALRAAIHLALLGPNGLRETARLCYNKAHYAARQLAAVPGLSLAFEGPFFKEFVLRTPGPAVAYVDKLVDLGYRAGVPLSRFEAGENGVGADCLLVAVTEKRTRAEIDGLVEAWKKVL